MNHLKILLFTAALIIGTSFMIAQNIVAHINTQDLVETMPEMIAAQIELKKLQETYDTDIQTRISELDVKVRLYESESQTQPDHKNQIRVIEIEDIKRSIDQFRTNALKKLGAKEIELLTPLLEKATDAVTKVARAQGFQYVLDSTPGQGVILSDGKDLLADVKSYLGY